MPNQFYKGRTNNHLTWVMVDATDFATPESALSAAMTIKIWGKLRGAAGVNFVSSGAGSLTNDIQHVGPSVLGLYTIALAKADLSDASAAWYDQYVIALSAAGAARQVLVVDGGIDASAISAYQSRLSDLASYLVALSGLASDAHSAATLGASRALVMQSRLSDFNSAFVSQLSDFRSDLASFLTTTGVGLNASAFSDIRSAIAAGPAATVTASDISDIASAVNAILGSRLSDILSAAVQTNSRALVVQSMLSDVQSVVSNINSLASSSPTASDIASAVWAHAIGARVDSRVLLVQSRVSDVQSAIAAGVELGASSMSDLRSAITAVTATVSASDMSDIASRVDVLLASRLSDILSAATQVNSRVLLVQSRLSDFNSAFVSQLSDFRSDLGSFLTTTGVGLNASAMSDIRSAITAGAPIQASDMSDLRSAIAAVTAAVSASDMSDIASRVRVLFDSDLSDILSRTTQINSRVLLLNSAVSDVQSAVTLVQSMASDAASAAQQANSRILVVQSIASDLASKVSDVESNLLSVLGTTGVQLNASTLSDLRSAITAGATGLDASALSDIASAVVAAITAQGVGLDASTMSDIRSSILSLSAMLSDAHSAAAQGSSRALVAVSTISDVASMVAAGVPLDASTMSDLRSAVLALSGLISDAHSAAAQGSSRALVAQSQVSDVYSLLSSRVPKRVATDSQLSALASDVLSAIAAGVPVSASDMSDLRSAINAGALTASDIASAVGVELASRLSDILSATQQTNSRALVNASAVSDIYSLLSDLHSDVGVLSGVVSDVYSNLAAGVGIGASGLSDVASAVWARAGADPTTVVSPTGTMGAKLDYLTALGRNKITQTATVQSLRNDADSADIASAAVSDDGTTFTRGEFA